MYVSTDNELFKSICLTINSVTSLLLYFILSLEYRILWLKDMVNMKKIKEKGGRETERKGNRKVSSKVHQESLKAILKEKSVAIVYSKRSKYDVLP